MIIKEFLHTLLLNVFPIKCCACGSATKEEYLCDACKKIEKITVKVCDKCGLTVTECDCMDNAFYFDAVVAPFYNKGIAQNVVYRMKFSGYKVCFDFVANEMTLRLKDKSFSCDFDAVCCVPMYPVKKIKRGYNQSYELAKRIASRLDLHFAPHLIKNVKYGQTQHTLSKDERFANVRGKYKCTADVEGKRILLVDDIRTTGATLSECARILKLNGAKSVVCLVAAVSQNYIEKTYKN